MLSNERISMSTKEGEKVDALLAEHGGEGSVTICRADPGESGPVLVQIGDNTWRVTEARTTKVKEG